MARSHRVNQTIGTTFDLLTWEYLEQSSATGGGYLEALKDYITRRYLADPEILPIEFLVDELIQTRSEKSWSKLTEIAETQEEHSSGLLDMGGLKFETVICFEDPSVPSGHRKNITERSTVGQYVLSAELSKKNRDRVDVADDAKQARAAYLLARSGGNLSVVIGTLEEELAPA